VFKETPKKEDIIFTAKDRLEWWIKIYVGDKILDLSYERVEKLLRK
jgi:hypothetical protein